MDARLKRRHFLGSAAALGLGVGLGGGSALRAITPARPDDLVVGPDAVRFRPEIEPVVRWIEETPRDRTIERAISELKAGLSYRDLCGGVFLAAIRNIKPRPVGFKFHAVMVVNSAHLLGQAASAEDRLLPLLWALDNFKGSQLQDVKEGDWTLEVVNESHLPDPTRARQAFVEAMDAWDSEAADAATAALCRSGGAAEVMEPFWHYGIRDQRNIGHKAIFAMQCWRTLQTIGWPHAEPVLRSLAFGLLDRQGEGGTDSAGPYEANLENVKKIRDGWTVGKADPGATASLLDALRQGSPEEASAKAVELLNDGASPEVLWDAVTLGASELLMHNPGIVALHAATSTNALHYIFGASGDETNRKLALLQACGWVPMFRQRSNAEGALVINKLEPLDPGDGTDAVSGIFEAVGGDRAKAARMVVGYVDRGGDLDDIYNGARQMILRKGRDSHQYKYGAAAWEESLLATDPKWRTALAAASMFYVPGADAPDSPLMTHCRDAVREVLGG